MKSFGDLARWAVMGFFGAIILAIVFVKAGSGKSGQSGGQQSAQIITAFGDAGSKIASGLEGA
jgi:hypothetical protein